MPEEVLWASFFKIDDIFPFLEVNQSVHDLMEVGCGYGTFTIPAARLISGKLFAFDIDPVMIQHTREKAISERQENIGFFLRDIIEDGSGLPDDSMDYVMLFNILHHSRPSELLLETFRVLKNGGKAGIIHWRSDIETPRGPALSIRPTPEHCINWARQNGFLINRKPEILGPYHFGLIIQKTI